MINNILRNLPPVVKNILLLNVLMFILSLLFQMQGIHLTSYLGGYVFNSPLFEPYQMVTHFFMHGGFFHILFNMFALVVFGPVLEQVWGPKRFFIFYVATALGAFLLHQIVGYIEVSYYKEQIALMMSSSTPEAISNYFYDLSDTVKSLRSTGQMISSNSPMVQDYIIGISVPVVGASGAVFGILVAFGYLFPNTRLMLLFPPIPIKAKWLVLILIGVELYYTFNSVAGDNVAHLAHIGGAIVGFILVLFWQKNKKQFY